MQLPERTEDAGVERWPLDPLERHAGALCISARDDVVRTWGLVGIGRPELVVRGCPGELVEVAKALLWDLARWVVSTHQRLEPGDVVRRGDAEARLEPCDDGLELWEHDPAQGGFVPGLARALDASR
jgi:hypothetical protein